MTSILWCHWCPPPFKMFYLLRERHQLLFTPKCLRWSRQDQPSCSQGLELQLGLAHECQRPNYFCRHLLSPRMCISKKLDQKRSWTGSRRSEKDGRAPRQSVKHSVGYQRFSVHFYQKSLFDPGEYISFVPTHLYYLLSIYWPSARCDLFCWLNHSLSMRLSDACHMLEAMRSGDGGCVCVKQTPSWSVWILFEKKASIRSPRECVVSTVCGVKSWEWWKTAWKSSFSF